MVHYAVLKGKVVASHRAEDIQRQVREQIDANYTSNHLHIIVDAGGTQWRCPVNVKSQDGSEVWLKIRDAFTDHPIIQRLDELAEGLMKLPDRQPGRTLDYVREPLFDRLTMRQLPKNSPGDENDVQDMLQIYCDRAQNEDGAWVCVFGSFWRGEQFKPDQILGTDNGVHDIHMNQGNGPNHTDDNGIYQDGGLVFYFPGSDRHVGAFLCFNSQGWFNDDRGFPLEGHARGPLASGTGDGGAVSSPGVSIIAAVINPAGTDSGHETVTLFNAGDGDLTMTGWRLVDRNGRSEGLDTIFLPRNESRTIRLSGDGAQLSNSGGSLRLLNADGAQVDAATWTSADAVSGRIVSF